MNAIVSVKWLKDNLEAPQIVILNASFPKLDSKSEGFLEEKVIPRTRFFDIRNKFSEVSAPFPSTFPSVEQFTREAQALGINKDSIIIIYDDKGIYSSARAWWLLKAFGHHNVSVLDGGLPEWNRFNYITETYHSFTGPLGDFVGYNRTITYMKFFKDIRKESETKSHVIIDARNKNRFNGLVDEPKAGLRRGTIPNSINLPYEDLLEGNRFKSVDQLKHIFNSLIKPSDKLTFSCGSGITACILALGAHLSGYHNISVYDGSWTEYGTLTS